MLAGSVTASAQCPEFISCGIDSTVNALPEDCDAVYTFNDAIGVDSCAGFVLFVSDNANAVEIPVALITAGYQVYNDYTAGDNPTLQGNFPLEALN